MINIAIFYVSLFFVIRFSFLTRTALMFFYSELHDFRSYRKTPYARIKINHPAGNASKKKNLYWALLATLFVGLIVGAGIYQGANIVVHLAAIILTCTLLLLARIDIRTMYLPDFLVLPLLWFGLIFHAVYPFNHVSLAEAVLSCAAAYSSLFIADLLFFRVTGKNAIGGGDLKLFAAICAWFGWAGFMSVLIFGCLLGCVFSLIFQKATQGEFDTQTPSPFGPALAFIGWVGALTMLIPKLSLQGASPFSRFFIQTFLP